MAQRLKRGFYSRGGKIWVRSDPLTGKRCSTGCTDARAAELWRAERERLAASPEYTASTTATIGKWVSRVLAIKTSERSEGTLHMYNVKLGHVARLFGKDSMMASVTAPAVDAYISARRKEGAASNTIARELTCLRQVLRYAKRAGEYAGDIATVMPIGFASEYEPVKRTLNEADLPKLLDALQDDTERAWVCLAISLAADPSDIERMQPGDYDKARNVMRVRGSKTVSRDAPVPVLARFRELFDYGYARLPVSWTNASGGLGRACKRAGLPHLSPKDLRRSAATWLIEAGVDQNHVSRFLRHKGDQMVRKVYGQMSAEALGKNIDGTDSSQRITGPLGGKADAGDLKCHTPVRRTRKKRASSEKRADQKVAAERGSDGNGTHLGTETSQRTSAFEFALGGLS